MAVIDVSKILQPERMKAFGVRNRGYDIDWPNIPRINLFLRFDEAIPTISRTMSVMVRNNTLHNVCMEWL